MSVVAVTVRPENYVLMACDGVCTDHEDGSVRGYVSKIAVMPELNVLMGVTGLGGLGDMLKFHMPPHVATFDDLVDAIPEYLPWVWDQVEIQFGSRAYRSCVALAGWSDARQKFEGWRGTTYDKERTNTSTGQRDIIPAFSLDAMPENGTWATAGSDPEIMRRFGVIDGPASDTDVDAIIRTICSGRAESGIPTDEGLAFNAGGFVQVAHLLPGHIQTWIAHRWPEDMIGQPIDPTRGQPLPDHLMAHYNEQA